ncbi:hypothetical protein ACFLWZ_08100 [Chloroflexota bacterium]
MWQVVRVLVTARGYSGGWCPFSSAIDGETNVKGSDVYAECRLTVNCGENACDWV